MSVFDWSTPVPDLFWEIYDRWISPSVVQALEVDLHGRMLREVPAGGRVLDVGAGGGQHAVRAARERPDLQITGIDIAPAMVKRARRLAQRARLDGKLEFQLGDVLSLPFADEEFDAVYCAGPLKQVNDKPRAMRECYRVLRRGGRLLVMDVNRACTYEDVVAFSNRTPLPELGKRLLKVYFSAYVARQAIDLDEARALWAELPMVDGDPPRPIPGHPAFVMAGTKP